jgi:integrase/recombinase XerD
MRGRKVEVGGSSCIVYVRHRGTCPQRADQSGMVECECIRSIQFRDGSRESTHEWKWSKAEEVAKRKLAERLGLVNIPVAKPLGYSIGQAVKEWIEEREQNGIDNTKARLLTKKLLAWTGRQGWQRLEEIQKQALRVWRTEEWKYQHGDSTSMKVHWGIVKNFFKWCVEGDLLAANPCPPLNGKIKEKEVIPFTPEQIDLLLETSMVMPKWSADRRLKVKSLILLMRWSGMAINDTACLERAKLVGQHIQRNRRKKSQKGFTVPIPLWVADALRELPNNDPRYFLWYRRASGEENRRGSIVHIYGGWFREVCDAAGMPEGHSHMLRHSFATYHLANGVPVERVSGRQGPTLKDYRLVLAEAGPNLR